MPESAETKIIKVEDRLNSLESSLLTELQSINTTLATLSENRNNTELRLTSQAKDIHEMEADMKILQLTVGKNGQITQAALFLSGAIVMGAVGYLVNHL